MSSASFARATASPRRVLPPRARASRRPSPRVARASAEGREAPRVRVVPARARLHVPRRQRLARALPPGARSRALRLMVGGRPDVLEPPRAVRRPRTPRRRPSRRGRGRSHPRGGRVRPPPPLAGMGRPRAPTTLRALRKDIPVVASPAAASVARRLDSATSARRATAIASRSRESPSPSPRAPPSDRRGPRARRRSSSSRGNVERPVSNPLRVYYEPHCSYDARSVAEAVRRAGGRWTSR